MQGVEYFNGELERHREFIGKSKPTKRAGNRDFEAIKKLAKVSYNINEMYDIIANEYHLTNDQVKQLSGGDFLLKHKDFYLRIKGKIDTNEKTRQLTKSHGKRR